MRMSRKGSKLRWRKRGKRIECFEKREKYQERERVKLIQCFEERKKYEDEYQLPARTRRKSSTEFKDQLNICLSTNNNNNN